MCYSKESLPLQTLERFQTFLCIFQKLDSFLSFCGLGILFFNMCCEILHKMTLQYNSFFLFTDEIMHQDIIPLYAADIQDQLKKQFAYLSGKTLVFPPICVA